LSCCLPFAGAPGVLLLVGRNAGKHSTRADVCHERHNPAIGGRLGGRRAGGRCCEVFHGVNQVLG